jgi:hypothetical protein
VDREKEAAMRIFPMIAWDTDDAMRGESDRSPGAQQSKADEVAGVSGKADTGKAKTGDADTDAPGRHREPFTSM